MELGPFLGRPIFSTRNTFGTQVCGERRRCGRREQHLGFFTHSNFDPSCFRNRMADETEQMNWQGDVWSGMFVHRDYCRNTTTGRSPFENRREQMSSLMKLWIVVCGDQGDATGHELDDLVVTRGNDDTGLNPRQTRDLTTLGRCVVAESATEVFSCAYEACSAWDVLVPNHENGTPTTGRKYVAEYDVDNDLCLILARGCPGERISL